MVNVIELKTSIYNQLSTIVKTFENGNVDKDEKMPYITYSLESTSEGDTDSTENVDFLLEVTILDHNLEKDTTAIENYVNSVDKLLAYKTIKESNFYWWVIRQLLLPNLPTTDEFTFRREFNFIIKTNISEEC